MNIPRVKRRLLGWAIDQADIDPHVKAKLRTDEGVKRLQQLFNRPKLMGRKGRASRIREFAKIVVGPDGVVSRTEENILQHTFDRIMASLGMNRVRAYAKIKASLGESLGIAGRAMDVSHVPTSFAARDVRHEVTRVQAQVRIGGKHDELSTLLENTARLSKEYGPQFTYRVLQEGGFTHRAARLAWAQGCKAISEGKVDVALQWLDRGSECGLSVLAQNELLEHIARKSGRADVAKRALSTCVYSPQTRFELALITGKHAAVHSAHEARKTEILRTEQGGTEKYDALMHNARAILDSPHAEKLRDIAEDGACHATSIAAHDGMVFIGVRDLLELGFRDSAQAFVTGRHAAEATHGLFYGALVARDLECDPKVIEGLLERAASLEDPTGLLGQWFASNDVASAKIRELAQGELAQAPGWHALIARALSRTPGFAAEKIELYVAAAHDAGQDHEQELSYLELAYTTAKSEIVGDRGILAARVAELLANRFSQLAKDASGKGNVDQCASFLAQGVVCANARLGDLRDGEQSDAYTEALKEYAPYGGRAGDKHEGVVELRKRCQALFDARTAP